jgi:hypothetical protein
MAGHGGTDNTPGDGLLHGGGQIASRGGGDLQNISSVADAAVAEDSQEILLDGEPVTPTAARRVSAAAAQGYRGTSPDPGAP